MSPRHTVSDMQKKSRIANILECKKKPVFMSQLTGEKILLADYFVLLEFRKTLLWILIALNKGDVRTNCDFERVSAEGPCCSLFLLVG